MIQERVRQNLKGSGRVGGGGFPYDAKKYIHTDIHGLHRIPKMPYFAAFSREIGRSKSDD